MHAPSARPLPPKVTPLLLLTSLAVTLLVGLVFMPGLPGEFLFDDIPNIVNNRSIHLTELSVTSMVDVLATPQVSGSTRSLPALTFALDYWRSGGAEPAAFKITNILIHALTAAALAWLFRSLLLLAGIEARRVAWLAPALALAWAVHPLQVSSVLYAVQRLQTMGTLFLVLALIAYLQGRQAQVQGRSGRTCLMATVLLWAIAMGCKEDSALLPAYTLALELTVLRFAAAQARTEHLLRRGYLLVVVAGAAAFLLWFLPGTWRWEAYPGRDFNSLERLLTQPRMLCMYLWQIVWPLPHHMPFHYDWVQPSRSLWQPWTTLPAIAVVVGLLVLAWHLRHRRPLLALGVMMYFSAHFITSNVIGLELAFEHRNHFALIGAVLALGSLLAWACTRLRLRPPVQVGLCVLLLAALGTATLLRAHDWRSGVSLAEASTRAAPDSPRAWIELCDARFKAGGGVAASNPHLNKAIQACASGADAAPESLNNLALLVVLKTIRGDVTPDDWQRFQQRLDTVRMSWDNTRAPLIFSHYAGLGVELERPQLLKALETLERRASLTPSTLVMIGNSLRNDLDEPDQAMTYYLKAIEAIEPGNAFAWQLGTELRNAGRPDLAKMVEQAGLDRLDAGSIDGRNVDR